MLLCRKHIFAYCRSKINNKYVSGGEEAPRPFFDNILYFSEQEMVGLFALVPFYYCSSTDRRCLSMVKTIQADIRVISKEEQT